MNKDKIDKEDNEENSSKEKKGNKKSTKILRVLLCIVMPACIVVLAGVFGIRSCCKIIVNGCVNTIVTFTEKHTRGDFEYVLSDIFSVRIVGLSEEGKQKEVIVIPEKIDGYEVKSIELFAITEWDDPTVRFVSDKLKVVYLIKAIPRELEIKSPVFEKAFLINTEKAYHVTNSNELNQYVYCKVFFENIKSSPRPANVTYYYNYDGAKNYGCYWLDNLDDGEKITYIPASPTREGYAFGGWYHEPECITPWNFETDTVKACNEEDYNNQEKFIENKLYAKWL